MALGTPQKVILGVISVPVILLVLVVIFWDPNLVKGTVEEKVEDVEGHGITFGNIEHSLLSPGKIAIHDVNIQGEITNATIAKVMLDLDVSQAINRRIILDRIELQDADFKIDMEKFNAFIEAEKNAEPEVDVEADIEAEIPVETLLLQAIRLKNFNFEDTSALQQFDVQGLDISIYDVLVVDNYEVVALSAEAPISAKIAIGNIEAMQMPLGQFATNLEITEKVTDIKSLKLDTGSSLVQLSGTLANLQDIADIRIDLAPSRIDFEEFKPLLNDLPIQPSGVLELSGDFLTSGDLADPASLTRALTGNVELGLEQGKLLGIDVNQIVTSFKDSKETSLQDVGGFLISGPIGLIASNVFDLGGSASGLESETLIPQLKIKGAMEQGNIVLKDTALATDKYRLAFDGAINPSEGTFKDFTFAVLDKAGCADLKQTLNGEMSQPTSAIAKSLLDTAISPLTGLISSVKRTVSTCKPFYQGEVAHPSQG